MIFVIKTFVKKPVEIQALLWDGCNYNEIREFVGDACSLNDIFHDPDLIIHTLEGDHHAAVGDWIIRGVKGEFYPCKPDIFKQTYDAKE